MGWELPNFFGICAEGLGPRGSSCLTDDQRQLGPCPPGKANCQFRPLRQKAAPGS